MADAVSLDARRVLGRTPVLKQRLKSPRVADLSLLAETNKEKAEALKDLGLRSDNLVEERRHIESAERVRNESVHLSSKQLAAFNRSPMSESESVSVQSSAESTTSSHDGSECSSEEALNSYFEIPGWLYADADMKTGTDTDEMSESESVSVRTSAESTTSSYDESECSSEQIEETVEEYVASLSSSFPFLVRHLPDSFEPTLEHTLDLCAKALQDLQESDDNRCSAASIMCELSDRFELSPEVMERMAAIRLDSSSFQNRRDAVWLLWELYDRFACEYSLDDIQCEITSVLSEIATDCAETDDPDDILERGVSGTGLFAEFWWCKDPQKKRDVLTPPMLELALRFVRNDDWTQIQAGLFVLGVVAQGCTAEVASTIAEIALTALKHTVFCGLLHGLADDDFYVKLGSSYVIEKIFGEDSGLNEIRPHLNMNDMLWTIGEILERPVKKIFEDGYEHFVYMKKFAFATVKNNKAKIADHYNRLIDALYTILHVDRVSHCHTIQDVDRVSESPSERNRCVQALRCIAIIGRTNRNESEILTTIPALVESLIREEDWWEYDYGLIVLALNDVWKKLSDDPFLPIILEHPLYALTATHFPRDSNEEDEVEEEFDHDFWNPGDIKRASCEMMETILSSDYGESIAPYTAAISAALIAHCEQTKDIVDIRLVSNMVPVLIKSVQDQGVAAMRVLWNDYYGWMERSIKEDAMTKIYGQYTDSECWDNQETKGDAIVSLTQCIQLLGEEGVGEEEIKQISRMILELIEKENNNFEKTDRIYSNELPSRMEENKKIFLGIVANLVDSSLVTFGRSFYESIADSLPLIVWFCGECGEMDGIAVAGRLVKFDPKSTFAYEPDITRLLQLSLSSDELVRLMAAWTAGVMAASQHEGWMGVGAQSLAQLCSMIGREGSRSTEDDSWATEHAIAAVAKILKFCGPEMVGLQQFNETLALFTTWLPVSIEEEQAVHTYGYVADIVEAKNAIVLGENGDMTGAVVHTLYEAIVSGVLDDTPDGHQLKERLCDIISGLTTIRR